MVVKTPVPYQKTQIIDRRRKYGTFQKKKSRRFQNPDY